MRPQELYAEIGTLHAEIGKRVERLAFLRLDVDLWDPEGLRVDSGSPWSAEETRTSLEADLRRTEEALSTARAGLESAWSALGRLSTD